MSWKVVLTGNKVVLEYLSNTINDKELSIVKENKDFILKSECFDSSSDYREVRAKVLELLSSVNAVLLLFIQSYDKLNYRIYELKEDGRQSSWNSIHANPDEFYLETLSSLSEEYNIIRDCRKLSEEYDNVRDVFQLINSDFDTWYTLYKVHEYLTRVEKFTPVFEGIDYNKESKRFKQTANSHRHADKNANPPPDNPMPLYKAKKFIKDILIQWIDIKERELIHSTNNSLNDSKG